MYSFFNLNYNFQVGGYTDPSLTRLIKQQMESLDSKIKYYRDYQRPIENTNPLSRLVNSFLFSVGKSNLDIHGTLSNNTISLAAFSGINTSAKFVGGHKGLFYPYSTDYLIAIDSASLDMVMDINENNWMEVTPVTCSYHSGRYGADYYPMGGIPGEDYSVIAVDIPLLGVMYKYWAKLNSMRDSGTTESENHFIARYVIPNMLKSQFTVTMWNMGQTIDSLSKYEHGNGLFITGFEEAIEGRIKKLVCKLKEKDDTLEEILLQYPSSDIEVPLLKAFTKWNTPVTNMSYPLYFLAWLPYVEGIIHLVNNDNVLRDMANRYKQVKRTMRGKQVLSKLKASGLDDLIESKLFILDAYLDN